MRIRNVARERFLPSVCTPKPLKKVKERRCLVCLARYSGKACNAEHHSDHIQRPLSIYELEKDAA